MKPSGITLDPEFVSCLSGFLNSLRSDLPLQRKVRTENFVWVATMGVINPQHPELNENSGLAYDFAYL